MNKILTVTRINSSFFCGSLLGHSFHLAFDLLLVTKVVVPKWFQVLVEFVHQRHTGRDVDLKDIYRSEENATFFGDIVKVLHDGAD
jgi:hypothetical protein